MVESWFGRVPFGVRRVYIGGLHRELTERIIGAAIDVHTSIGPGLLESTYEECLAQELRDRELAVSRQVFVPLLYKGKPLGAAYRLDLLVEKLVIVEVKAVERLGGIPFKRIFCVSVILWRAHRSERSGLALLQ